MTYTVVRVPEITKTFRLSQSYLHKYGGVASKVFCMLIFLNYGHCYKYYSSSHQIAVCGGSGIFTGFKSR